MKKEERKDHRGKRETLLYRLGWAGILLLLVLCLVWTRITNVYEDFSLPCLFQKITGFYCPGCGGTRAFRAFLKGRFWKSFLFHPAVFAVLIWGSLFMVSQTIERISKGKWNIGLVYRSWYLWVVLGLVIFHFVSKNLLLFIGIECLHP